MQTSLVEATYIRDKRTLLLPASRGLVRERVCSHGSAASLHCISLDQEAHFNRETSEIGRMIGGWLRSLAQRNRKQDVAARSPSEHLLPTPGQNLLRNDEIPALYEFS